MRLILDVGCGNKPKGTINCDLYPYSEEHRRKEDWKISKIPNFVQCDAHSLPFKSNSFDVVYCHHVLEHVEYPLLVLKEFYHVSREKVIIVVPDLKTSRIYGEFEPHLYSWSKWSLEGLMQKVFDKTSVIVTNEPLQLKRKNKLSHFINFLLKRVFVSFPFLYYSQLIAVGYCKEEATP